MITSFLAKIKEQTNEGYNLISTKVVTTKTHFLVTVKRSQYTKEHIVQRVTIKPSKIFEISQYSEFKQFLVDRNHEIKE